MKKINITQTVDLVGKEVELYGWVDTKRDHKRIVFIEKHKGLTYKKGGYKKMEVKK